MIIALHGRGSNGNDSTTVNAIKDYFNGVEHVFAPSYDSDASHDKIARDLTTQVSEHIIKGEELHFVGVSMGGYWARYLANLFAADNLIMINPSLQLYAGDAVCNEDWADLPITVYIGLRDQVVDPNYARALYKDRADVVTFADGDHRMHNHFYEILPHIESAINTIAG